MKVDLKKKKKEAYQKPEIRSETVEMTVYGSGTSAPGGGPLPVLQPLGGFCCN